MTNFSYTRDIPFEDDDPSVDQPDMKINTNSIDDLLAVDHISFNLNNGGTHNVIHFTNQLADPANSTFGQLYTKTLAGNNELYYKAAGSNVVSQLTSLSVNNSPGFIIFPGGLIMQWGTVSQSFSSGSTIGTVNFSPQFTNNCFIVTGNPLVSFSSLPSSQASVNIRQSTLSKTKFDWQFYTNSSEYIGFYWFAVGN